MYFSEAFNIADADQYEWFDPILERDSHQQARRESPKSRILAGLGTLALAAGLSLSACGGSGSSAAAPASASGSAITADQILGGYGFTPASDASTASIRIGLPSDVTGFALTSWNPDGDVVAEVVIYDNTTDAQNAYNALYADINSGYDTSASSATTALLDSGLAVEVFGTSEVLEALSSGSGSTWISAGS